MQPSPARELVDGIRSQAGLLVGVTPFGLAYGAYAVESGVSNALAQAMSAIVFGGASQVVAVELIASGTPAVLLALTVALVNLRHMLYSADLAPDVEHLPRPWRWLLAYLLTDEAYAMTVRRYREPDASPNKHWFFLGSGIALWTGWQLSTAVGLFAGAALPDAWALDFALPLTFIAILVPAIASQPALAAATVAGAVALMGYRWEYGTGLLLAGVLGITAGLAAERIMPARKAEAP